MKEVSLAYDNAQINSLVAQAQSGDNNAIEQIIVKYKNLVRSVARRFFLTNGDNEDLIQEGTIGVFEAIKAYDNDKGSFSAFAKLCVTRKCIAAFKKDISGSNMLRRYISIDDEEVVGVVANGEQSDPLAVAINNELLRKQAQALDNLSARERQVYLMYIDGYTYVEMSQKLNMTTKQIDNTLCRGKKKILTAMSD